MSQPRPRHVSKSVVICLAKGIGSGMIFDTETDIPHPSPQEVIMSEKNVLRLSENFDTMTAPECLKFIERSRRQIDRLAHLPQKPGEANLEELASIRQGLDALEKRIREQLTN
jgi:hypothetical protein